MLSRLALSNIGGEIWAKSCWFLWTSDEGGCRWPELGAACCCYHERQEGLEREPLCTNLSAKYRQEVSGCDESGDCPME